MPFILSPPTLALRFRQNNGPTPSGDYQPSRSLSMAGSVGQDGFLKVTVAKGLLANDHDVDGNNLRVSSIVSSVTNGALQLSLDGSFTYKPAVGFFGTDSFTYKLKFPNY